MKKKSMICVFFLLVLSLIVFAQDAQTPQETQEPEIPQVQTAEQAQQPLAARKVADATPLFLYSIIFGTVCLALAAVGGAFAQSKALRTAVENIGRNPSASDSIRGVLIIGLALIESLVIYVLLVDLILYFVKWGSYNF